jgi:hypothetical protein
MIATTRNLDNALRHLRHSNKSRLIWIDALCINQNNISEKSIQVSNMGNVYRLAKTTISWLGPEENQSSKAINLLRTIATHVKVDWHFHEMQPSSEIRENKTLSDQDRNAGDKSETLSAAEWGDAASRVPWTDQELQWLSSLFSRSYFERAWIVQEISLSNDVVFQCGLLTFAEDDLWKSIFCLKSKLTSGSIEESETYESFQKAVSQVYIIGRLKKRYGGITYVDLREHMKRFHCRDPHDIIYANLKILKGGITVVPDYSLAVKDVFIEVARRSIEIQGTLELLVICELSSIALDIPSWVPDWATPLRTNLQIVYPWSACASISPIVSFSNDGLNCTVTGISITEIRQTFESSAVENESLEKHTQRFLQLIKPTEQELNMTYQNGQSLVEAYAHTLVAGGFQMDDETSRIERRSPRITEAISRIYQEWFSTLQDPTSSHAPYDAESYLKCMRQTLEGRCLFKTNNGYIGLSPTSTRKGDVICVVFGCQTPILLRPVPKSNSTQTWLVVGACYVHGLMSGEAIYQGRHRANFEAVWNTGRPEQPRINGWRTALYDIETKLKRIDPDGLLEEAGIKVERYTRSPHELVVLPASLRAAGIAVEDFVLV